MGLVVYLMKRRDKKKKKKKKAADAGPEHGKVNLLGRPPGLPYTDDDEAAGIQMKPLATTNNIAVR